MGELTSISWTDHTFNGWWGCEKVSPACKFCYAEEWDARWDGGGHWGALAPRKFFGDKHWALPLTWDRRAREAVYRLPLDHRQGGLHRRPRVFCQSMSDVFENRPDLVGPRARLFKLIDATPYLDWLLLTKRPENILAMTPDNPGIVDSMYDPTPEDELQVHIENRDCEGSEGDCCWGTGWLPPAPFPAPSWKYRHNVWLGTTVENQEYADIRIPELLRATDACRFLFLSVEPMLGPVDLTSIRLPLGRESFERVNVLHHKDSLNKGRPRAAIDWVIAGGESGRTARPSNPRWFRSLRDQCSDAGVPFHFKQHGEWVAVGTGSGLSLEQANGPTHRFKDDGDIIVNRVGKKAAGRMLYGAIHDAFPEGVTP